MARNPVVHFEMPYLDAERVTKFYGDVFGWKMNPMGADMGDYLVAHTGETDAKGMVTSPGVINGGFYKADMVNMDSTTHVVISVEDIQKTITQVTAAGGKIKGEIMDIPGIGKYISIFDSEGNSVGVLQPLPMSS